MKDITTEYRNIIITYQEYSNSWMCDLFTKAAESLEVAKKRIDAHLDKVKKKPFARFKAYVRTYSRWECAEITSIADDQKSAQATIGRERKKIDGTYGGLPIFPVSDENTPLFNSIIAMKAEIDKLQSDISKAEQVMVAWKPEA